MNHNHKSMNKSFKMHVDATDEVLLRLLRQWKRVETFLWSVWSSTASHPWTARLLQGTRGVNYLLYCELWCVPVLSLWNLLRKSMSLSWFFSSMSCMGLLLVGLATNTCTRENRRGSNLGISLQLCKLEEGQHSNRANWLITDYMYCNRNQV